MDMQMTKLEEELHQVHFLSPNMNNEQKMITKLDITKEAWKESKQQISTLEEALAQAQSQTEQLQKERDNLLQQLKEKETEISSFMKYVLEFQESVKQMILQMGTERNLTIKHLNEDKLQLESCVCLLQEELQTCQMKQKAAEADKQEVLSQLVQAQAEIENLRDEKKQLHHVNKDAASTVEEMLPQAQSQTEQVQKEMDDFLQQLEEDEAEISSVMEKTDPEQDKDQYFLKKMLVETEQLLQVEDEAEQSSVEVESLQQQQEGALQLRQQDLQQDNCSVEEMQDGMQESPSVEASVKLNLEDEQRSEVQQNSEVTIPEEEKPSPGQELKPKKFMKIKAALQKMKKNQSVQRNKSKLPPENKQDQSSVEVERLQPALEQREGAPQDLQQVKCSVEEMQDGMQESPSADLNLEDEQSSEVQNSEVTIPEEEKQSPVPELKPKKFKIKAALQKIKRRQSVQKKKSELPSENKQEQQGQNV